MKTSKTITSAATSINKNKPPAIVKLVEKLGGFKRGQSVFDYGCGKYPEVTEKAIKSKTRVSYAGYDTYNRTQEENDKAHRAIPDGCAHVVLLSNVLNVIHPVAIQAVTVVKANRKLRIGGTLYITVYEGDKSGSGRETKKDCWQENRKTEDYMKMIQDIFGKENVTRKGKLIIARKTEEF